MRVLVTGGAGYIGSFVVKRLLEHSHEVRVLDDLSTGSKESIPNVPLDVGDVRDRETVQQTIGGFAPDAVVHLAGLKSVGESVQQPGVYYDVNVVGSLRVLEASIRFGVSRFVFSSSCAVYGSPQVCPVDEATPVRPLSPYGETKLAAERMLRWQARGSGMRYAALRYFNVAGAAVDSSLGEFTDGPAGQLVPRAIQAALSGGAVEIFGYDFPTADGTALRDFIHVEDLATAHVRVLEQLESPGLDGIYNLGTGQPVSVKTVLDQIEREAGRPIKRLIRPRREGDPAMSWADFGLAGRTFGWSTEYDFDDIVRSAVRWHRSRIGGVG